MAHYNLAHDLHSSVYFHSDESMSAVLLEAGDFVKELEANGAGVVAFSTADYVSDNGKSPLYTATLTFVR